MLACWLAGWLVTSVMIVVLFVFVKKEVVGDNETVVVAFDDCLSNLLLW